MAIENVQTVIISPKERMFSYRENLKMSSVPALYNNYHDKYLLY